MKNDFTAESQRTQSKIFFQQVKIFCFSPSQRKTKTDNPLLRSLRLVKTGLQ